MFRNCKLWKNNHHTHRVVCMRYRQSYMYVHVGKCLVPFPHSGDHANALLHYERGITKSPEVHMYCVKFNKMHALRLSIHYVRTISKVCYISVCTCVCYYRMQSMMRCAMGVWPGWPSKLVTSEGKCLLFN